MSWRSGPAALRPLRKLDRQVTERIKAAREALLRTRQAS
jgi:hypothetical protein